MVRKGRSESPHYHDRRNPRDERPYPRKSRGESRYNRTSRKSRGESRPPRKSRDESPNVYHHVPRDSSQQRSIKSKTGNAFSKINNTLSRIKRRGRSSSRNRNVEHREHVSDDDYRNPTSESEQFESKINYRTSARNEEENVLSTIPKLDNRRKLRRSKSPQRRNRRHMDYESDCTSTGYDRDPSLSKYQGTETDYRSDISSSIHKSSKKKGIRRSLSRLKFRRKRSTISRNGEHRQYASDSDPVRVDSCLGQEIEYRNLPPKSSPQNKEGASSDYIWVAIPRTKESISHIESMKKGWRKSEPYYSENNRAQVEDRNPQSISGRTEEQFENESESRTSPSYPKVSEDKEMLKDLPKDERALNMKGMNKLSTRNKSRKGKKALNCGKKTKESQSNFASDEASSKENLENEIDSRTSPPKLEHPFINSQDKKKKTKKQESTEHKKKSKSRLDSDQLESKKSLYEEASSEESVEDEDPTIESQSNSNRKQRNTQHRKTESQSIVSTRTYRLSNRHIDNARSESDNNSPSVDQ